MIGKFQRIQADTVNEHTQQRQCDIEHVADRRHQQSCRDEPDGNFAQIETHTVETSGDARTGKADRKQADITQYISETADNIKGELEDRRSIFPVDSARHHQQQTGSVQTVHELRKFAGIDDQSYSEEKVSPDDEHPAQIGQSTAPVAFAYRPPDAADRKLAHCQNKAEKLDIRLFGGTCGKIAETLKSGDLDIGSRNGG